MKLDPKLARLIHTAEAPGILYGACFDSATGQFYGGGTDGFVYCINARPEQPFAEKGPAEQNWRPHDNYIASLAWHEGIVISAGYDRRLVWTKAESSEKLREITAHEGWVRALAIIPGRQQIASVGDDMVLKIWDVETGELIHRCAGHALQTPEGFANALYAVAASDDGKQLASADRCGQVCVWDAETGQSLARFKAETFYTYDAVKRARSIGGIRSLCFLPEGNQLVLGGIGQVSNVDGFVGPCRHEVWDWQAAKRVALGTDKHQAILNHLEYLPSENLLIGAGGGDGGPLLAFWDPKTEAPVAKAKPKSHIQHFAFDHTKQQLLAAGHGGLQVWAFTPAPAKAADDSKEKKG